MTGSENRFVDLWKYDQFDHSTNIKPIQSFSDFSGATISRDNKIIIGMDRKLIVHISNVNTGKLIGKFINDDVQSFARINSIQIDRSEHLVLINEDIFCIRSGKLIHSFERFCPHISGIFMNNDINILINSELWDLRTLNLLDSIDHLKNIAIKTTMNDDILIGRSVRDNFCIHNFGHHDYNWSNFRSLYGKFVALYNGKDFSQLSNISFK
ncbi:hypothetical protein MXB_1301 [Myxobolus squamalis]|nr:hypothetical protein MXB_1301 [Myxobolus squamalis]